MIVFVERGGMGAEACTKNIFGLIEVATMSKGSVLGAASIASASTPCTDEGDGKVESSRS